MFHVYVKELPEKVIEAFSELGFGCFHVPSNLVGVESGSNIEPYELFKPTEALPPEMPLILNKCLDEAVVAVTQTLNQIRSYYLPKTKSRSKKAKQPKN